MLLAPVRGMPLSVSKIFSGKGNKIFGVVDSCKSNR